ncbi:MAG: hypothetical protein R3D55_23285 [Chloroflexota bacterium]
MQLDLELYREEVTQVESDVRISYIRIAPERQICTPSSSSTALAAVPASGATYQIEEFAIHNEVIAIDLLDTAIPPPRSRLRDGSHPGRHHGRAAPLRRESARFVLAGHSYGVAIATEFAWRYPERVSHLILIAGAGEYSIFARLQSDVPPAGSQCCACCSRRQPRHGRLAVRPAKSCT